MAKVHHCAVGTRDIAASLRFWCEGLGLEIQMDEHFEGDWPGLFGGSSTRLRSVFLGDPTFPDVGLVELVEMADMAGAPGPPDSPTAGFFLLSLMADLDVVLPRLAALGVGGTPRLIAVSGVALAVVHDPNGVRVELMDSSAQSNLEHLTRTTPPSR